MISLILLGLVASTTTARPDATSRSYGSGKFKWFGVDESIAEFGPKAFPGTWGKEFYFPDNNSISTLKSQGFNVFRVPFAMERMNPDNMTGPFWQAYLTNYTASINAITSGGAYAIVDPHNYGRYYGNIINDTAGFQTFWCNLAAQFKSNERVMFDTNNEYHDMDQKLVFDLNQAAINGIRDAGACQYVMVEGNMWSGAWHWAGVNDNLATLKDPQNKIIYQMHQYLDTDGSGTSHDCVSGTIGQERLATATDWLRSNGKVGFIGEFAGGNNTQCLSAITGMLDYMLANTDVWLGAAWWAGGPWWADYVFSFEPPNGTGYMYYNSCFKKYLP